MVAIINLPLKLGFAVQYVQLRKQCRISGIDSFGVGCGI